MSELEIGTILDRRFEILGTAGDGGSSHVYRARQIDMDRLVAVKMLRATEPDHLGALRQEARAAGKIEHRHVARLQDLVTPDEGAPFLVYQYVPGPTLRQLEPPLPAADLLRIAEQVASGLDDIHRAGLLHRDIKPENIKLRPTPRGQPPAAFILDFGLCGAVGEAKSGPSGGLVGTPAYASPEQLLRASASPASDIFSLGVVLFELATGQHPFEGCPRGDHAEDWQPSPLLDRQPSLPRRLVETLYRCLAFNPEARPSAAELVLRFAPPPEAAPRGAVSPPLGTRLPSRWLIEGTRRGRFEVDRSLWVRADAEEAQGSDPASETRVELTAVAFDPGRRPSIEVTARRWLAPQPNLPDYVGARHLGILWSEDHLVLATEAGPAGELADHVGAGRRWPPAEALQLVHTIAKSLQPWHRAAMAHLDIRPATVRLDDGQPVLVHGGRWPLLDLGLPFVQGAEHLEALRYKAPEQLDLLPGEIGPPADLYGLGALLFTLLTGQAPFEGDDVATVLQAKGRPPARLPSDYDADIPASVDTAVARMLNPRPEDRGFNAVGLIETLQEDLRTGSAPSRGPRGLDDLSGQGPFVGRRPEMARVMRAKRAATQGRGSTVVVQGAPGVGKTRLAEEIAFQFSRGRGVVLRTKPAASARATPFEGIRAIFADLDRHLARASEAQRRSLTQKVRAQVQPLGQLVAPLSPGLGEIFEDADILPQLEPHSDQQRRTGAIGLVLQGVSEHAPLCLLIDDLQWTDGASRNVLEYLASVAPRHRMLVLVTTRPTAADAPSHATLSALRRGGAQHIELGPLDPAVTYELIAARVGDPKTAQQLTDVLHDKADGSPSQLLELLRQAQHKGLVGRRGDTWAVTRDLMTGLESRETLIRRMQDVLSNLPAGQRRVLAAASVLGATASAEQLEALSGLPMADVIDALAHCLDLQLLAPARPGHAGYFRFPHDAAQEAAMTALPATQMAALHRQRADDLRQTGHPEAVQAAAYHLVRAGPAPDDVPLLADAARAALQTGAPEAAVEYARAAQSLGTPEEEVDMLFVEGDGLMLSGRPDDAARIFERLRELGSSEDLLVEALLRLGRVHFQGGRFDQAMQAYDRALDTLGYRPARGLRATKPAMGLLAVRELVGPVTFRHPGEVDEPQRQMSEALFWKAIAMFFLEDTDVGPVLIDALYHARRSRSPDTYARALCQVGGVAISGMGRVKIGTSAIRSAIRVASIEGSSPVGKIWAQTQTLQAHQVSGDFAASEALMAVVVEDLDQWADAWVTVLGCAFRLEVLKEEGRVEDAAVQVLRIANVLAPEQTRAWAMIWARQFGAWVLREAGRPDLALLAVEDVLGGPHAARDRICRGYLLARRVTAHADLDDAEATFESLDAYERHLETDGIAFRHVANCSADLLRAVFRFAVREVPQAKLRYERLVDIALPVLAPFEVFKPHAELARLRRDLLNGDPTLAVRAERAVEAYRHLTPRVALAELYELAAITAGATHTPRGRAHLDAVAAAMASASGFHTARQRLASHLGRPPPRAPPDLALRLAKDLGLDPA